MQGIWHEWLLPPLNAIAFWASPRCGISWNEDNPDGSINQSDEMAEIGVILGDSFPVVVICCKSSWNRKWMVGSILGLGMIFCVVN